MVLKLIILLCEISDFEVYFSANTLRSGKSYLELDTGELYTQKAVGDLSISGSKLPKKAECELKQHQRVRCKSLHTIEKEEQKGKMTYICYHLCKKHGWAKYYFFVILFFQ